MKTAVRMLSILFGLLLLWSCQALVEKPEMPDMSSELPSVPIRAVLTAAPADNPAQARALMAEGETSHRPSLFHERAENTPVNVPVRDRNGTPLTGRSYVRTVYTACRLEETSG